MCKNYPKAFEILIGDGLYLKGNIFKLLEAHHKYSIAVLKEERRQLFEEANNLSLMVEPKTTNLFPKEDACLDDLKNTFKVYHSHGR